MAKKKRVAPLPRVTVLAFNRKDLLAFCEAVEALRTLAPEMRLIADQMKQKQAARRGLPAPEPSRNAPTTGG